MPAQLIPSIIRIIYQLKLLRIRTRIHLFLQTKRIKILQTPFLIKIMVQKFIGSLIIYVQILTLEIPLSQSIILRPFVLVKITYNIIVSQRPSHTPIKVKLIQKFTNSQRSFVQILHIFQHQLLLFYLRLSHPTK